jgi:hypothetical protein
MIHSERWGSGRHSGSTRSWAALRQARSAARQADTAASRHLSQTEADRERRIIESLSTAVDQLGSEKLTTRLGGIYTLERLSQDEVLGDEATILPEGTVTRSSRRSRSISAR